MHEPPIPVDEEQRLEDLHRLDILLTTPEEVFDNITRELASVFEVSAVMMSFTDRDTQYYKSAVGLPPEQALTRTEPRELSVCSYVLAENRMMVVDDLLSDDRFRTNPIVLSSGARFYAGTPLQADSGRAVGTLCLVDNEPRTLGARERDLLRLIAEGVMAQVKLQIASRQLLQRTQQIERDLQQAVQMQRFLLPPANLEGAGWRITHLYLPFEDLGGDFLGVHPRPDGRLAILAADVSGHGTSAALTVAMAKTAFHRVAPTIVSPSELLNSIHQELLHIVPPGRFMTALSLLFDPNGRQVTIASAGHPYPLRVHDRSVEVVRHDNEPPLLIEHGEQYANQTTLQLAPGDRILVYTDGAIEAADRDGRQLGIDGLSRFVQEVEHEGRPDPLAGLLSGLRTYAANRFDDDVALMLIEML